EVDWVPSAPARDERVYCDRNRVVVPLTDSFDGRVAQLPRFCIKCGATEGLESWHATLVAETRQLDQTIPIVKSHFWMCHRHARIARFARWAGLAMLLGLVALFLIPFGTRSFFGWERTQDTIWVIAMSVLFGLGLNLGGPWRGPVRLWKASDQHFWLTGT